MSGSRAGGTALAEPSRRQILDLLRGGERSVNDLVARLELSQPGVSKHLRVLREAGLVEVRLDRLDAHLAGEFVSEGEAFEAFAELHEPYAERFGLDPEVGRQALAEHHRRGDRAVVALRRYSAGPGRVGGCFAR